MTFSTTHCPPKSSGIVVALMRHMVAYQIEWFFACELGGFGLLMSGQRISIDPYGNYSFMATVATAQTWSMILLAVASIRIMILSINGSIAAFRPYSPLVRSVLCGISATLWTFYCVGCISSKQASMGTVTGTLTMLFEIGCMIRISRDAGVAWGPCKDHG